MDAVNTFDVEYDLREDFSVSVQFTPVEPSVALARKQQEEKDRLDRLAITQQYEDLQIDCSYRKQECNKNIYTTYGLLIIIFIWVYIILIIVIYSILWLSDKYV